MKISIKQEHIVKALTRVGRIISTKAQLPIIQNILITTEDGRIKITATNLETTEIIWMDGKIDAEGGICVPARLISEFVSSLPQDIVKMEVKEGQLIVSSKGFRANIPGMAKEEFPPTPTREKSKESQLDKDAFIESVGAVLFSAATDEGRPILTGVKFKKKEDSTLVVATDGYRLSLKKTSSVSDETIDLVVPARALAEVVKIGLEEKEGKTMSLVKIDDTQLGFIIGDTEIYTRGIEGEYPNFEKIIPKTCTTTIIVEREQLVKAAKSAAIFARDNANIIKVHIENNTLTISANTPQVGENKIDVEGQMTGDTQEIAFNSRFFIEAINNMKEEKILFEMTGALNPGAIKSVGDDSFLHIIMPVRLQE